MRANYNGIYEKLRSTIPKLGVLAHLKVPAGLCSHINGNSAYTSMNQFVSEHI